MGKITIKRLFWLIRTDIERYSEVHCVKLSSFKAISIFLLPSLQSIFLYRLANYLRVNKIKVFPRFLYTLNIILYSADILPETDIGPYFYMPHPTGIFIYGSIGQRCSFYAQAAIGGRDISKNNQVGVKNDFPVLGDDVSLGCRAAVLGRVRIGSGSVIGAYSLVLSDIPGNAIVVGIPGKVVKYVK